MMKVIATTLAASAMLAGCATMTNPPTERVGQATLSFANGLPAGTVQLLQSGSGTSVAVALTGMSPGVHGFHLHTTGKCEAPGFASAGGHLNPHGRRHGTLDPLGPHLGDMPNLEVGASGTAAATLELPGDRAASLETIFDADGTAVIVHAGPDDYRTDPSGNSGDRVACGVLRRTG